MDLSNCYQSGFVFRLSAENKKWCDYITGKKATQIGVWTVCCYFFDSLQKQLVDSLKICTDNNKLADNSMELSKKNIKNWEVLYSDFLQNGESCLIAIPGYEYVSKTTISSLDLINEIVTDYPLITQNLSKEEYAKIVDKLYLMTNGYLPQEAKGEIRFYLPGGIIAKTKGSRVSVPAATTPKTEIEVDSFYKVNPKARYFVLHTADRFGKTSKAWILSEKKKGNTGISHGFIMNDCELVWMVDKSLEEERYAVKQEYEQKTKTSIENIKGTMIHIETVYNCTLNKDTSGPTDKQYEALAKIYASIYFSNDKKKLIIVPHREVDRGITKYHGVSNRGHDDPWNFDLAKFYTILREEYGIQIVEGTDGVTIERFKAKSEPQNKIHWPPILSGDVEND